MAEMTIQQEQAAFDAQLPELLKTHAGEFVLMKGGQVVAFFPDTEIAYGAALDRYGLDSVFLIAKVEPPKTEAVSFAWELGVMS